MDFSKLTKQELLDLVVAQQTLSEAVEHKDKEIATLKEEVKVLQKRPSQEEVEVLRKRVHEFDGSVKKEDIEKYTKELENELKIARNIANQYIRAHRDLLRIFKVNLDFAISHDELLADKLK